MAPFLTVFPLLLIASCQEDLRATGPASSPAPPAETRIRPADGAGEWWPDRPIAVTVSGGKLRSVSVRSEDDAEISGALNAERTQWVSRWTLQPATSYTVVATAVNPDGKTSKAQSSFRTLRPPRTLQATTLPEDGQEVGVGMPIVVRFDTPIRNKRNVERAFEVRASERVRGAWHWMSDEEVHFRPKKYWPTDTKVRFRAHLAGVRAAEDVYGTGDLAVAFTVGDKHVTRIDTDDHVMVVKKNGEKVKTFPISAGKPSTPTTSGTHVAFEKSPTTIMDSATIGIPAGSPGYYRITTHWTVKFTYSGLYTHAMPSTVWAQGNTNVSHGCVNMSTSRAKWFYDFTQIGDIIKVTGTSRELEWGNGWTDWEMSWDDWVEGSAFDKPIDPDSGTVRPE